MRRRSSCLGFMMVFGSVVMGMAVSSFGLKQNQNHLSYEYYKSSCPNLETIVKTQMFTIFFMDPTAPAAFLRLMFHDCQVQGCDASILLDSNTSEMSSSRNFGIRKREMISDIKAKVEEECESGRVSCADIIVLAAREAVSFSGGPHIEIPLGRKDSITCSFQKADAMLPSPTISLNQFISTFFSKGFSIEESVAILGAHTLGVGHCINIVERLYNPEPGDKMNLGFEATLRLQCPTQIPFTNLTFVPNDLTPTIFDNQYYRNVLMGKGLFGIDSSISRDPRTSPFVKRFALDQTYFFKAFSSAFLKLSSTNVLTAEEGEVRRQCNSVN